MLLLRLGLRRGEAALLAANAIKDDIDPATGNTVVWIDVECVPDEDPWYEQPGLKTVLARRQLPVPQEIAFLTDAYVQNYWGRTHYPYLLMSQKRQPISLRAMNDIFETVTDALSDPARRSLEKRGLIERVLPRPSAHLCGGPHAALSGCRRRPHSRHGKASPVCQSAPKFGSDSDLMMFSAELAIL
ncbi:hypothetical protein [Bradyrhizobium cenepequi]